MKLPELGLGQKVIGIVIIYISMAWAQNWYANKDDVVIPEGIKACVQKIMDGAESEFITDEMYEAAIRCGEQAR